MPTVGDLTNTGSAYSYANYANMVATTMHMPENGWITGAHVIFGGYSKTPWSCLAIWDTSGNLVWSSAGFTCGVGRAEQSSSVSAVRSTGATSFLLGFWRDPNSDAVWGLDYGASTNWGADTTPGSHGPSNFYENVQPFGQGALSASFDYVANATPNPGVWQSPTPSGTISDTDPTFSGTVPQNPADSAYDICSQISWQITRTDTGEVVAEPNWSVNDGINQWSASPSNFGINLEPGITYSTRFTYADSWGAWSGWSAAQTFTINAGPNAPSPSSPTGKQLAITGLNFTANYTHGSGLAANAVQVQIRRPGSGSLVSDSGIVSQSVASGSNYTVAQWAGANLQWASSYEWWTRARDTSNVWGPWSVLLAFTTDAPANVPVLVSPVPETIIQTGNSVTLSAGFSTPDGSNVTDIWWDLFDLTTNTEVSGFPAHVTGIFPSGSTQTFSISSYLIGGHAYEWRAQSSDGTLKSPWSGYWTFYYSNPPTVSVTAPTPNQVENAPYALISITYGGTAAKASDQTVITDTTGSVPIVIFDSGAIAGSRTSWYLPYSTLMNGHSYSVQVTVVDTNGLSATSAAVAFSVTWTATAQPDLRFVVNGTDYSGNIDQTQWRISQNWGRQGDTAQFYVIDEFPDGGPHFHFQPMQTVQLQDVNIGKLLFGGLVTGISQYRLSPNMIQWKLDCQSPAAYLQGRIISSDYTGWTADAIARDILRQSDCGITGNHILPGPIIAHFKGLNHTAAQALTKLCTYASTTSTYGWWVDGNSDLHFGADTQADAAPSGVLLTDQVTAPATATRGYYQNGTQSYYEWDANSVRNRIIVVGGVHTQTATEQFVGDGTTQTFTLSYPIQTNPLNITLLVGGSQVPISNESGATTPWILIEGAPGVWTIATQPGGQPPGNGTIVTVTYDYAMPVIVQAQSATGVAAVQGPNKGLFDALITEQSLTGLVPAQQRALRELEEYALAQERVHIYTSEDWPGWLNVGESFVYSNALTPDSQNGWAAGITDTFLVIQLNAQGVAGGYRTNQITAVRI